MGTSEYFSEQFLKLRNFVIVRDFLNKLNFGVILTILQATLKFQLVK